MNKGIVFRKVKKEDARGWYTLVNKVWRDAYKDIFPEEVFIDKENKLEEHINNFSNKIKNSDTDIAFVALYNDEIIGIMCGCINSHYEHFSEEYADLTALYINPIYQGLGIGTKLKSLFEEWAEKNGATKYEIGVLKDNIKAREVYESWGGELSDYEQDFVKLGINYPEVFYIFNLNK